MAKNKTLRVGKKAICSRSHGACSMIFCARDFAEGIENVLW
jgi:hypothetical protein